MTDLAAFLTARLNVEQQLAEDAAVRAAQWNTAEPSPSAWGDEERPAQILADGKPIITFGIEYGAPLAVDHVAYWDPARVLAEIAAKRRVLARHQRMGSVYRDALVPDACEGCGLDEGEWNVADINECPELLDLAAPFSGHEDFDESWRT